MYLFANSNNRIARINTVHNWNCHFSTLLPLGTIPRFEHNLNIYSWMRKRFVNNNYPIQIKQWRPHRRRPNYVKGESGSRDLPEGSHPTGIPRHDFPGGGFPSTLSSIQYKLIPCVRIRRGRGCKTWTWSLGGETWSRDLPGGRHPAGVPEQEFPGTRISISSFS